MSNIGTPSEIAREALRRMATQQLQPTPANFTRLYYEVAGSTNNEEEAFPARRFRRIVEMLPRATPEQVRLAQQFESATSRGNWRSFEQQLVAMISASANAPLPWSALIQNLVRQLERRHEGLSSSNKVETLQRLLQTDSEDLVSLHTRLQTLAGLWAQRPSMEAETERLTSTEQSGASRLIRNNEGLAGAPESCRLILASLLEDAASMILIDAPDLCVEARALARTLRSDEDTSLEGLEQRLKDFSYKMQWVAQDQSAIRQTLLNLLQLVIENIGELVIDDKWLHGQVSILRELLSRPLDNQLLEEMRERLRTVILKQGTLKQSLSVAQSRMREMLAQFVDRLGELAESTGNYEGKISAFAGRVTEAASLDELSGLVDEIVRETRTIEQRARSSRLELQALRETVDQANKEISRLESELQQASALVRRDPLTGSLNRKGLDEMLKREVAHAVRQGSKLCLAMLDVDDFKKLNDTFGHSTGDQALKHLAAVIRENIRPQDTCGRYGGEEFLLLMPDTALDEGIRALQRLQRELTRRFFLHDNQKLLLTFSAGVAELQKDEPTDAAIQRADEAMYRAKRTGKNRVERAT